MPEKEEKPRQKESGKAQGPPPLPPQIFLQPMAGPAPKVSAGVSEAGVMRGK